MNTKITETKWGRMEYPTNDHIGLKLVEHGSYEAEFIQIICQNCFNKGVALDIGAHIGNHTLAFAKRFDTVLSFEPQKALFDLLNNNLELNNISRVRAHNFAIGHVNGVTYIDNSISDEEKANYGDRSILTDGDEVKMRTIDSLDIHPDLIKIDVEGAEKLVIFGGKDTIQKYNPIIFMEDHKSEEFMVKRHFYHPDLVNFDVDDFIMNKCNYRVKKEISKNLLYLP